MKKTALFIIINFIFILGVSAQGVKEIAERLPDIQTIIIDGNVVVSLVEAEENFMEGSIQEENAVNFNYTVSNGEELSVKLNSNLLKGIKQDTIVNLTITAKSLKNIVLKNGACIISNYTLTPKNLNIDVTHKSIVGIEVDSKDVNIVANSNSEVKIEGKTDYLVVKANFESAILCEHLESQTTTVTSSTEARCYVNASGKMDINAKSRSKVYYQTEESTILVVKKSSNSLVENLDKSKKI